MNPAPTNTPRDYPHWRPAASTVVSIAAGFVIALLDAVFLSFLTELQLFTVAVILTLTITLCLLADRHDARRYYESFTKADALCSGLRALLFAGFGYFIGVIFTLINNVRRHVVRKVQVGFILRPGEHCTLFPVSEN